MPFGSHKESGRRRRQVGLLAYRACVSAGLDFTLGLHTLLGVVAIVLVKHMGRPISPLVTVVTLMGTAFAVSPFCHAGCKAV